MSAYTSPHDYPWWGDSDYDRTGNLVRCEPEFVACIKCTDPFDVNAEDAQISRWGKNWLCIECRRLMCPCCEDNLRDSIDERACVNCAEDEAVEKVKESGKR